MAERAIRDMSNLQKEVATEQPLHHVRRNGESRLSRREGRRTGVQGSEFRLSEHRSGSREHGESRQARRAVRCGGAELRAGRGVPVRARRTAVYFALNLAVAIATSLLFLGGAAGAIVTAVSSGVNIWTAVFGGTSVVGAFGLFIGRPVQMTYAALLATTRLDWLQLISRQRMQDCGSLPTLTEQIKCRSKLWDQIRAELASLDEQNGKTDSAASRGEHPAAQAS